jgi:hypothetical protein
VLLADTTGGVRRDVALRNRCAAGLTRVVRPRAQTLEGAVDVVEHSRRLRQVAASFLTKGASASIDQGTNDQELPRARVAVVPYCARLLMTMGLPCRSIRVVPALRVGSSVRGRIGVIFPIVLSVWS